MVALVAVFSAALLLSSGVFLNRKLASSSEPSGLTGNSESNIKDGIYAGEPDPTLMEFLTETDRLKHLQQAMATISWDECDALFTEGRPKLLSKLGRLDIKLSDRQKFVTAFGKATKPAIKGGQPGGGRAQPEPFVVPPADVPGESQEKLLGDVKRYQSQVIRDGIPARKAGLFPAGDEFLLMLMNTGWKPCTKGLIGPTVDGGYAYMATPDGWASGDNAIQHGMDLRWFIHEGFGAKKEGETLMGAVRYSESACIGRGFGTSVHGGAVETCLDEATAELAKTKLFPQATTAKIEFKINKPVQPHVTYRVFCEVTKENVPNVSYEVRGEITEAMSETNVLAVCNAKMANPVALN